MNHETISKCVKDRVPIEQIDFAVTEYNILKRKNVNFVDELLALPMHEIFAWAHTSKKHLNEIIRKQINIFENMPEYQFTQQQQNLLKKIVKSQNTIKENDTFIHYSFKKFNGAEPLYVGFETVLKTSCDDIVIGKEYSSVAVVNFLQTNGFKTYKEVLTSEINSIRSSDPMSLFAVNELQTMCPSFCKVIYPYEVSRQQQQWINAYYKKFQILLGDYAPGEYKIAECILKCKKDVTDEDLRNVFLQDINVLKGLMLYLIDFIVKHPGLTFLDMYNKDTEVHRFFGQETVSKLLSILVDKKKIYQIDDRCYVLKNTLKEYINNLPKSTAKEYVILKLQGFSVTDICNLRKVSRQNVNKEIASILRSVPNIIENEYLQFYKKYKIENKLFQNIFGVSDSSMVYIEYVTKRKNKKTEPEDLLKLKKEIEGRSVHQTGMAFAISLYFTKIDNLYIKKTAVDIFQCFAKKHCLNPQSSTAMYEQYNKFLKKYYIREQECVYHSPNALMNLCNRVEWMTLTKSGYYYSGDAQQTDSPLLLFEKLCVM